jgi:effector-binding domain-containing protein
MKKWFLWLIALLLFAGASWYFFLKEYHYRVSFTTSESPGIVYKHLMDWKSFDESDQLVEVLSGKRYSQLEQRIQSGDSVFHYIWKITPEGSTKTRVTAYITDEQHGFRQKIEVPFKKNDFVRSSIWNVKLAGNALIKKAEAYQTHSIKDTLISPRFCAYVSVTSNVNEKASAMLKNIAIVMDYIKQNNLELQGDPFLEVTKWDQENDLIQFDFCFPIKQSDSLPATTDVLFKTSRARKVLKAEFNGNYRISSNAWYTLLDHAERNNIEAEILPIEYFLDDPHAGGNPLEWKALIFLPLKD